MTQAVATVATKIGTYELVRRVADDARANVFEAYCTRTARRVWLRVLKHEHLGDDRSRALFHREARALLLLVHPNVTSVVDYSGRDVDEPFLATEHVPGSDLETLVSERGAIEARVHAAVFEQAARGLAAAHKEGLVHRGVSPQSVFVGETGRVLLQGFGSVGAAPDNASDTFVSKNTAIVAPSAFTAPEISRGVPADQKSDLFSLGVTMLYALLGGSLGDSKTGDARDSELLTLAAKLRSVDPDERPPSAEEVASLLSDYRDAHGGGEPEDIVAKWLDPKATPPKRAAATQPIAAGDARTAFMAATKGRYELKDAIGEGGMGKVFRATDKKLGRDVAVKVILGDVDVALRRRFHREARAMGKVHHPNIVEVLDYSGQDAELPFLVLEYVDGTTLAKELKRTAGAEVPALCVTLEIARALACVHGEGFVHRDVKPDNIFLDKLGRVLLADFGIVRRSAAGRDQTFAAIGSRFTSGTASIGSPYYASPEQLFDPDSAGPRSDLFSLGSLLTALLVGDLPIAAKSVPECLAKLEKGEFKALPAGTAKDVQELVTKLHANDPKARPESAQAVCAQLEAMLAKRRVLDPRAELRKLLGQTSDLSALAGATQIATVTTKGDRATQVIVADAPAKKPRPHDHTTSRLPKLPSRATIPLLFVTAVLIGAALTWFVRHRARPVVTTTAPPAPPLPREELPPPPREELPPPPPDENVVVPPDPTAVAPPALPPKRKNDPAIVRIVTKPWADVTIDGKPFGRTPIENTAALSPGSHILSFENPAYRSEQRTITVKANEQRELRVELKKK